MDETEKVITAYTLIADQIARQDNIVHQRTTAGLSINAVLGTLTAAGYAMAGNHLKEPRDFVIFALMLFALAFVAIWVSFNIIRSIAYASTQNAYLKRFYDIHWQEKVTQELNLPRPFGGPGYEDKTESGKIIKTRAGRAGALFRAIIFVWTIALAIMITTAVKSFLGD